MKWFLVGLVVVVALILAMIAFLIHEPRKARRMRSGQCVRCGYDMLRVDHARCPECGHRWEDD